MARLTTKNTKGTRKDPLLDAKKSLRSIKAHLAILEFALLRIETGLPSARLRAKKERVGVPRNDLPPKFDLDEQDAIALYDELVRTVREAGIQDAQSRLASMELHALRSVARSLGLPVGKKPSRATMLRGVLGRLREALLLSQNLTVAGRGAAERANEPAHPTKKPRG